MQFGYDVVSLVRLRVRGRWEYVGFLVSGALAFALTTWRLTNNGYANLYYAAAVKSMAANRHALFFASLDPSGFVNIDKPPLGFWIQVVSVWLLGFSPLALLLPQAIAGALAPPLLGLIMRRVSTASAAVIAAFALALTPIWIVSARDNIVDVPLALTLLLAAGALLQAVSLSAQPTKRITSSAWKEGAWLALAFTLIGVGFNIKMLEAYLVIPAFAITYVVCAKRPIPQRLAALLLALCVMVGVSLSWIAAVDLTSATARPYVGSTATNSEFDLAFGYNGLKRLLGKSVEAGEMLEFAAPTPSQRIGEPGPLRILQPELGSQVSWLAPFALLGLVVAWPFTRPVTRSFSWYARWRRTDEHATDDASSSVYKGDATGDERIDMPAPDAGAFPAADQRPLHVQSAAYVLFATWLLTGLVVFSIARDIDTYYLVVIAPALCAMVGVGIAPLWTSLKAPNWRGALVPIGVVATLWEQAYLMTHAAPHWATRPVWVDLGLGVLGALTLLAIQAPTWMRTWIRTGLLGQIRTWIRTAIPARILVGRRSRADVQRRSPEYGYQSERFSIVKSQAVLRTGLALLLLTCLITPGLWTVSSLTAGNDASHPIAGPLYAHAGSHHLVSVDSKLLAYLEAHRDGAYYLVATRDSAASAPLILATSAPIMTLGGFSGYDPILTPGSLSQLIASNDVRLFLLPANYVTSKERTALYAGMFPGRKGSLRGPKYMNGGALYHWIATRCAPIPPPQWSSDPKARQRLGTYELFNCSVLGASALRSISALGAKRIAP